MSNMYKKPILLDARDRRPKKKRGTRGRRGRGDNNTKKNCFMIHDIHIVNAFNLVALYLSGYISSFSSRHFSTVARNVTYRRVPSSCWYFKTGSEKSLQIFFFCQAGSPPCLAMPLFTWVLVKMRGEEKVLKSGSL